jgi:hypothetical protein
MTERQFPLPAERPSAPHAIPVAKRLPQPPQQQLTLNVGKRSIQHSFSVIGHEFMTVLQLWGESALRQWKLALFFAILGGVIFRFYQKKLKRMFRHILAAISTRTAVAQFKEELHERLKRVLHTRLKRLRDQLGTDWKAKLDRIVADLVQARDSPDPSTEAVVLLLIGKCICFVDCHFNALAHRGIGSLTGKEQRDSKSEQMKSSFSFTTDQFRIWDHHHPSLLRRLWLVLEQFLKLSILLFPSSNHLQEEVPPLSKLVY